MKRLLLSAAAVFCMAGSAHAEKIGVSIALLEHNFLGVMAKGMTDYAQPFRASKSSSRTLRTTSPSS